VVEEAVDVAPRNYYLLTDPREWIRRSSSRLVRGRVSRPQQNELCLPIGLRLQGACARFMRLESATIAAGGNAISPMLNPSRFHHGVKGDGKSAAVLKAGVGSRSPRADQTGGALRA
jgi:hypothetical protein